MVRALVGDIVLCSGTGHCTLKSGKKKIKIKNRLPPPKRTNEYW